MTALATMPFTSVEPFLRCMAGGQAGRNETSTDIFLTNPEHLGQLAKVSGLLGPESTVFVPEGSILGSRPHGARLVEYAGDFSEPGDEVVLDGEETVRLESYCGSEDLTITGPTVLRIDSEDDYLAFLADADRAVRTGRFPEQLTNPDVWLADICCLSGGAPCPGISRLYVSESGELRTSLRGRVLGLVGDSLELLAPRARRLPCACAEIPAAAHASAQDEWPWLPRYVAALHAQRRMRTYGRGPCGVSGFGARLVPGLALDRVESPALPLIVWDRAGCVLFSVSEKRSLQITLNDARLFELAFVGGSRTAAAALAEQLLGVDAGRARRAIARVLDEAADRGLDCKA